MRASGRPFVFASLSFITFAIAVTTLATGHTAGNAAEPSLIGPTLVHPAQISSAPEGPVAADTGAAVHTVERAPAQLDTGWLVAAPSTAPNDRILPVPVNPQQLEEDQRREAMIIQEQRAIDIANRTVVVENRTSSAITYNVFPSTGVTRSMSFTLPAQNSHRFQAPTKGRFETLTTLSPGSRVGSMQIAFSQPKYPGTMTYRLLTNRRYAFVQNTAGFQEMVALDAIRALSPNPDEERGNPHTFAAPGQEETRIFILKSNLSFYGRPSETR